MGRTKELHQEVRHTLDKLEELHPYMTLGELDMLQCKITIYKNRAILHGDNAEKRKLIPKPDDPVDAREPKRHIIFEPTLPGEE